MKKIFVFVFIVFVGLTFQNCKDSSRSENVNLTRKVLFKKQGSLEILKKNTDSVIATFDIEIADNDFKTQTGLMYRDSMEENQAMLFIFPDAQIRSFYMKNTEIPLDILYFNSDKTLVEFYENAKPFDETSLPSRTPSQYVLEINGGLSEKLGIERGDKIRWSRD